MTGKIKQIGALTQATGTYTTAAWVYGTTTVTWVAPETGLYLIWMRYDMADTKLENRKMYKQLQMYGSALKLVASMLYYDAGANDDTGFCARTISQPVFANKGDTVQPYVHTPTANVEFRIAITAIKLY